MPANNLPESSEFADQFHCNLRRYERLRDEVVFTLTQKVAQADIKTHTVNGRVKKLSSFIDKIGRKGYSEPFKEVEDIVGCRIVCLFLSDLASIGGLIDESFLVLSEEDKVLGENSESFGYMSVHYICKLHPEHTGPRYDGLGDLQFEIQVRTIVMDAWANISHYLAYKGENSIPQALRRDFHALSGLFYVADQHFEMFFEESMTSRSRSRAHIRQLANEGTDQSFDLNLDLNLDLDSMLAYLQWRYRSREHAAALDVSELIEEIAKFDYLAVRDVHRVLESADAAALRYESDYPPTGEAEYTDVGILRQALAIFDPRYRGEKYRSDRHSGYERYLTPPSSKE